MKKHEIEIGATYAVKVSGRVVPVQIVAWILCEATYAMVRAECARGGA